MSNKAFFGDRNELIKQMTPEEQKETLIQTRNRLGYTQQGFASRFAIPLSTLTKWEQGVNPIPSYVLQMLSDIHLLTIGIEAISRKTAYTLTLANTLADSSLAEQSEPYYWERLQDKIEIAKQNEQNQAEDAMMDAMVQRFEELQEYKVYR